jgi:hypothetical protein
MGVRIDVKLLSVVVFGHQVMRKLAEVIPIDHHRIDQDKTRGKSADSPKADESPPEVEIHARDTHNRNRN